MTQVDSSLHDVDISTHRPDDIADPPPPTTTTNEKTDAVITPDPEALGEEARAIDAQLHARVLRKIDCFFMPAMVIGQFTLTSWTMMIFEAHGSNRLWVGVLG